MQEQENRRENLRSMRDLLEVVSRHRGKVSVFFLTVILTTLGMLAFAPREYTSTAKLMVRRSREEVFPGPSSAARQSLPIYKEWESEINTELEILGSYELINGLVQTFGDELLTKSATPPASGILQPVRVALAPVRQGLHWILDGLRGVYSKTPEQIDAGPLGEAIKTIEKNLMIEARKKSDVITVSYTAASPELARRVVSELVHSYLDKRIDIHRVPGAQQFFTQQTERLINDLKTTEEAINSIKKETGISSLEDSRRVLMNALETVRALQLENQAALAGTSARIKTLRALLLDGSAMSTTESNGAILSREERIELQAILRKDEVEFSSLLAESQELDRQFIDLQAELAQVNTYDAPLHKLEREQQLLEEKYHKYSEDKEQVRINEELETKKMSNISIVQPATRPIKADPSGKLFKLLAALFLGMIGAGSIAFGADKMDPSLHSDADVSRLLGLKTLLEIPRMRGEELYYFIHPFAAEPSARSQDELCDINRSFQELVFRLLSLCRSEKQSPFIIGVTSNSIGEGVSSVAVHLAAAFTRDDRFRTTLLLDVGVEKLFEDQTEHLAAAPFTYEYISNAQEGLEDGNAECAMKQFELSLDRARKKNCEAVVVDLPSVSQRGDVIRMAETVDLVVLVVAAESVPWREALRTAQILGESQANLGGVVLNQKNLAVPKWLYRKL